MDFSKLTAFERQFYEKVVESSDLYRNEEDENFLH